MFEIVLLGTSASAPSIYRGMPSIAVLAGEQRFLVDCGEGTQRQILRSGIGFKKLSRILLTHGHLDHILGLGGLVSTFAHWEDIAELTVFGGQTTIDRVRRLLFGVVLDYERLPIEIHLVDISPGVLLEAKDYTVSAFPVTHRGSGNFGYTFEERSRHPFLVEKAEALGIPAGPERGQLVAGKTITLADGRVITPDMVLGDLIQGAKLVVVGDAGRTDNLLAFAKDADTLVIEATFLESEGDIARSFGHLTARQSALLAAEANVKSLILTHVSRRYRESDILAEARSVFPGAIVARDLDHYVIKRGQAAEKFVAQPDAEPEIDLGAE